MIDAVKHALNPICTAVVDNSEEEYTQSALLEELGYTDVKFIETFKAKTYDENSNDSATFLMAYKNVKTRCGLTSAPYVF